MPTEKRFLVLRHAPTAWNDARRIQGRADVRLTEMGRSVAGRWRVPPPFRGAACLSSPLARCLETARAMGLSPIVEERLVEMDWGRLEGLTLTQMRAAGGAHFAAAELRGLDFRPDGGETPRDVRGRAMAALADAPHPAVVVTHRGVMRALLSCALGWDMRSASPVDLPPHGVAMGFSFDGRELKLVDGDVGLAV